MALFLLHFTIKNEDTRGITLIATAQSETALHPKIIRSHLFKYTFKLMPPNREARRDVRAQFLYIKPSVLEILKVFTTSDFSSERQKANRSRSGVDSERGDTSQLLRSSNADGRVPTYGSERPCFASST